MKNKNLIIGIMLIAAIFLMSISSDAAEVTKYRDDNGTWVIYIQQEPDYFPGAIEVEAPPTFAEVIENYIAENSPVNPYQNLLSKLTDREINLICSMAWYEANNQSMEGQRAVIEVLLNRILSDRWPNDVESVLSQNGQFATWKNIKRNPQHYESEQLDALQLVCEEAPVLPGTNYVYFDTRGLNGKDKFKLQDHWFGRE